MVPVAQLSRRALDTHRAIAYARALNSELYRVCTDRSGHSSGLENAGSVIGIVCGKGETAPSSELKGGRGHRETGAVARCGGVDGLRV